MPTYEELQKRAATMKCQECGGSLSVAWGGSFGINDYIIRCGNNPNHKNFSRPYQPTDFEIIEKKEMKAMDNNKSLATRQRVTAMTEIRATEIVNSLWGDAPAIEKAKAIMVCVDYGANPLMKHVFLIPFAKKEQVNGVWQEVGKEWAMVFGIKFKRLLAYRVKSFSYDDFTPRLMTEDEQKRIYGEVSKDNLCAITILVDEKGNKYPGYGRYPLNGNNPKGMDKGNTRANMAMIRSESQALEKLAPGQMPEEPGVVDADYEEVPPQRTIDPATGEIKEKLPEIEKPAAVIESPESKAAFENLESASKPITEKVPAEKKIEKPARDPATITNFAQLWDACFKDFKITPKQAMAELGVNATEDITETPRDCYIKISQIRTATQSK